MNGVFWVTASPAEPMPRLDGRLLGDKARLLAALGQALNFPDYYGGNWDALDECLVDLSWHDGPLNLLITHAESIPEALREILIGIFADAALKWEKAGENSGEVPCRPFALYLRTD